MPKVALTFRLEQAEKDILTAYCKATGRNQSDVLREFVRSLKRKTPKSSTFCRVLSSFVQEECT